MPEERSDAELPQESTAPFDPIREEPASEAQKQYDEEPELRATLSEAAAAPTVKRRRGRVKPDSSVMRLTRVNPWTAALNALFGATVLAFVVEALVFLVWKTFDRVGVFDKIVSTIAPTGGESADALYSWFALEKFLTVGGVFAASLLFIIPVFVFFSALVFNLSSRITGGVKITLTSPR